MEKWWKVADFGDRSSSDF